MNAVTQVPQPPVPQFEKYCKLFVTDEEYDIMMGMKLRGNTEAELRALYTGSDWAGTLYDMCRKGFLLKIYDGAEPTYDLAPMLPGWFEFPLSTGEDSDTIQKASELFTSAINMVTTLNVEPLRTGYAAMNNLKKLQGDKGHMEVALPLEGKAAGKVVHVDRKLSNDTTSVVPSYQLEAYLDSLPDDAPISVMHCFCRNIRRREGMQPKHPRRTRCACVSATWPSRSSSSASAARSARPRRAGSSLTARTRAASTRCSTTPATWTRRRPPSATATRSAARCSAPTRAAACSRCICARTQSPSSSTPKTATAATSATTSARRWPPASTRRAARCLWSTSAVSAAACASRSARRTCARWSTATRALLQAAQEGSGARAQCPPPAEEKINARGGHCQGGL